MERGDHRDSRGGEAFLRGARVVQGYTTQVLAEETPAQGRGAVQAGPWLEKPPVFFQILNCGKG